MGGGRFPRVAALPRAWGPDDPCPAPPAGWSCFKSEEACAVRDPWCGAPRSLAGEGSGRGLRRCGGVTPSNAQGCPSSTVVSVRIPLVRPEDGWNPVSPRPVPSALSTSERCQVSLWLGDPVSVSQRGSRIRNANRVAGAERVGGGRRTWPQSEAPRPATERELAVAPSGGQRVRTSPRSHRSPERGSSE